MFQVLCHQPHRFLRGELPLSGVRTKGLVDLWQLQENGTDSEDNGFTFNALDDELVKRVSFIVTMVFCQDAYASYV